MPINSFLYPSKNVPTSYEVANSCGFNDNDSPSMYKTPSSGGNQTTWTFSTWFKRGNLGSSQWILDAYDGSNDEFHIYVSSGNAIGIYTTGCGFGSNKTISTNNLVRDVSAWYHLVVRCDTTQSTASNRLRIYLNGTECSYATYNNFTEDGAGQVSESGTKHWIGRRNAGDYFDGYFAEMVLVDGSSLAPTSFGEYDEDSPTIWKPKDVSGLTFGTNGFYLDFEDSSNLGNDANGGTDFTEANLAATDQATDTPTNNFATMNPLFARSDNVTFTEGNLKGALASEGNQIIASTIAVSAGKWYFEFQANAQEASAYMEVGIFPTYHTTVTPNYIGGLSDAYSLFKDGNFYNNGSATSTGVTYGTSDIMGVALDLDSGTKTIKYYKNGSLGTTQNITVTEDVYIGWRGFGNAEALSMNFGSPKDSISSGNADGNGYGNFEYAVPSGYYALCTKNLAEYG